MNTGMTANDFFVRGVTLTVEQYMQEKLCERGLLVPVSDKMLTIAKKSINEHEYASHKAMRHISGEDVLVKDCWGTYAHEYKQQDLDDLYRLIEEHILTDLINAFYSKVQN